MNTTDNDVKQDNKQLYFSLLSGEMYYVEKDEIKNLDKYQIPLKKKPKSSCNKCYGRMYIGFNLTLKIYEICRKCAHSCIDFSFVENKSIDIDVETMKEINDATNE